MTDLHKKKAKRALLKASGGVSLMTLLSRVAGLMRDIVIARTFGASAGTDAFFVAFKIPNFLRRLFAEGAFSQAFVPVLAKYRSQESPEKVQLLIDRIAGSLSLSLAIVTIISILAAPLLIMVFAPGFIQHPEKLGLASEMLQITFPYLLFISLTAFCGGILNTYGKFLIPAFTPIFLNIVMILAALFFAPYFSVPIMALAWGVFIAGIVQLLWQLPFLHKLRLMPRPRFSLKDEGVRKVLRLMTPAIFGVSVSQINLLLDTVLASFLQTGSVSWLYFSDRLSELPLGIFGIAIATVILPSLSANHAEKSSELFNATLDWGLRLVLFVGIPSAVGLFVLAGPLITTFFYYGEVTPFDVDKTSMSLQAYSIGLVAFMLIKILATGYFACHDTKTPVKIGIICMITNMVINLILIYPLAHVGLALATSIAAFLNAGLLLKGLITKKIYQAIPGWRALLLRYGVANAGMAMVLILTKPSIETWLQATAWTRVGYLVSIVMLGMITYAVVLLLSGFRPRHLHH